MFLYVLANTSCILYFYFFFGLITCVNALMYVCIILNIGNEKRKFNKMLDKSKNTSAVNQHKKRYVMIVEFNLEKLSFVHFIYNYLHLYIYI